MNTRQIASEYRLAQWAQAMQEHKASGESICAFCQRKGVSRNTYFYWQRKLRETACERLAEIGSESTGLAVKGFAEINIVDTPALSVTAPASQVCVEVGRYKVITDSGYPAESLAVLLRALTKPC